MSQYHVSDSAGMGWLPGTFVQKLSVLLLLCIGLWLAQTVNGYLVFVLANVALLAIVGIGLNALMGLVGQVSFGHVGFYAIGAYVVAILTTQFKISFWLAWPLGAVLAGLLGALVALPALRVRGPCTGRIACDQGARALSGNVNDCFWFYCRTQHH